MIERSTRVSFIKARNHQLDEIDADKILVSKRASYGKKGSLKYFIGYNENDFIRPLCIKLPQMIGYVKHIEKLFCG